MTAGEAAPRRRLHIRRILFKKRWMTTGAVVALAAVAWMAREPIADRIIRDQFDSRGIQASYTID